MEGMYRRINISTAPRRERKEIVSFSKWIGMIGWLYRQRLFFFSLFFFGSQQVMKWLCPARTYTTTRQQYISNGWRWPIWWICPTVLHYTALQPEERGWYVYSDCAVRLIRSPRRQRVGFDGNLTTTIRRLRIIIICAVLQRERERGCIFKWCAAATSLNEN